MKRNLVVITLAAVTTIAAPTFVAITTSIRSRRMAMAPRRIAAATAPIRHTPTTPIPDCGRSSAATSIAGLISPAMADSAEPAYAPECSARCVSSPSALPPTSSREVARSEQATQSRVEPRRNRLRRRDKGPYHQVDAAELSRTVRPRTERGDNRCRDANHNAN
jgi:hypothetical protein